MKKVLIAFLISSLNLCFSQAPVDYNELMNLSKKQAKEIISNGDAISIVVTEILLAEFDKDRPDKILEINCTIKRFDGSESTYSTVHRQIFQSSEEGKNLESGFFILRDVSLEGVEKITFKIGVRSVNAEQSKLFNIVANLLTSATESNPTVQTVKNLINTKGTVEENIPIFDATFHVPNNYINYQKIKAEDLKLAFLSTNQGNNIAFKKISKNIPRNLLARFANVIVGDKLFEDREEIGGLLVLKATKSTPRPLERSVLTKIESVLRSIKRNDVASISEQLKEAYNTLDIAYSDESSRRVSAYQNALFYLTLADCYLKFLKTNNTQESKNEFYNTFYQWVSDKINYSAVEDYSTVPVKGAYAKFSTDPSDRARVVDYYIPNNLNNDFIFQSLYMQNQMHINFKGQGLEEKIAYFTRLQ